VGVLVIPSHFTYYHLDHLGTPRILTDSGGVRVQGQHFLPFGEEMPLEAGLNPRKFTGHERDSETGLDYMLARYYSAPLGRFMSPDPSNKGIRREDPQSWNRYSYVRNDPVNATDPDGLKDNRSNEDKRILDNKNVRKDAQKAWKESKPEKKDAQKRQEAGFTVVEGKDGISTTGVTTGTVNNVETPSPDSHQDGEPCLNGDTVLADVHTHPAAGHVISDPETGSTGTANFEQSGRDKERATDNGVTSYVISTAGIYRFNPATDKSPTMVLDGKEFKNYMSNNP